MAVWHILSQDQYQQPSDLLKGCLPYQQCGEEGASAMDVSQLSVVGLESPKKAARHQSCLTISSGGIYFRDDVVLLVLIQNTTDVLYLNEHSPLFPEGVKQLTD